MKYLIDLTFGLPKLIKVNALSEDTTSLSNKQSTLSNNLVNNTTRIPGIPTPSVVGINKSLTINLKSTPDTNASSISKISYMPSKSKLIMTPNKKTSENSSITIKKTSTEEKSVSLTLSNNNFDDNDQIYHIIPNDTDENKTSKNNDDNNTSKQNLQSDISNDRYIYFVLHIRL